MRRVLRLVGATLLLVLLAGCRVETTIAVEAAPDGTGTVSVEVVFDARAVEALDGLADGVILSDLRSSGWQVAPPEVGVDGSITIGAQKPIVSAAGLQRALDEIAGPGVFTDVRLSTSDTFAERRQTLTFDVDLRDGWSLFSDDEVAAALGGEPFGVPIDQLTDATPLDDLLGVTVMTTLTGDDEQAPLTATRALRFDAASPAEVRIEATVEDPTAMLLRWIAIALGSLTVLSVLLAVTGLWLQRRADRLRPAPTPSTLSSRIPGRVTVPAVAGTRTPATAGRRDAGVRLVVIEPLAALYHQGGPAENHLLPFVRSRGGTARADVVADHLDEALRGVIDTATLWRAAGVDGESDELDAAFVATRRLHKEAPGFLRELERRRIPVAALSNDVAAWSMAVRSRDRLSSVWPWLVSGAVGAAKPDPGIFERLRRETGTAYGHCLYIDSRVENLDAARELGMRTALFDPDGLDLPDVVGHPIVEDLLQLVRRAT